MPELTIDRLISTLRDFKFAYIRGAGYMANFVRNELTDRLQELNGIYVDSRIVKTTTMKALCRKVLK